MGRAIVVSVALFCLGAAAGAEAADASRTAQPRTTVGGEHSRLAAGERAIRAGRYEEGIELTLEGLEAEAAAPRVRAAALSNLCAAHAARREPDTAIEYCTDSLALNSSNWRTYTNRAYAYWLKRHYASAARDVDAAAAIAPKARQVVQLREMIDDAMLTARVAAEAQR